MSGTQIEISPELQEKIDKILQKARDKIKQSGLNFAPLNDGSRYAGTYNANMSFRDRQNRLNLGLRDSLGNVAQFEVGSAGGSAASNDAIIVKNALEKMLEDEYNLFRYKEKDNFHDLDDAQLEFILHKSLKSIERKFPDEFSFEKKSDNETTYICTIRVTLPTTYGAIQLRIGLRCYNEISDLNDSYPVSQENISLSLGTQDSKQVEVIKQRVCAILKSYGIAEHHLETIGMENSNKSIPKEWIDLDRIRLSENKLKNGQVKYLVRIVNENVKNRSPSISITFSNITQDDAEEITRYIKTELVPTYLDDGEHNNDPLTIKNIRENVEQHFPEMFSKNIEKAPKNFDIRNVMSGINPVARLQTPEISLKNQRCGISVSPPFRKGDLPVLGTCIYVPLNTSNIELTRSRTNALQSLSKVVLEDYFQQSTAEIITYSRTQKHNKKVITFNAFRKKQPGETAPEGKVFFEDLRDDGLKPAYEQFNRYIYWETKITPEGEGYKISARIMRNDDAEEFPVDENIMGRTWEFRAADEKSATAFCHNLEEKILRKEHLFSRERPVEQFGLSSMRLVAKDSLLEAICESKGVEDLQANLTKLLKGRVKN